jgi:hypothetical protein
MLLGDVSTATYDHNSQGTDDAVEHAIICHGQSPRKYAEAQRSISNRGSSVA